MKRPQPVRHRVAFLLLPLFVFVLATRIADADDWPQWRGPTRDGVWRETGVIEKFSSPRLEAVWRAEISSGYSGPSVADGRVFITDRMVEPKQIERVHCFDAGNGTKLWSHTYDCEYRGVGYEAGPRASVLVDGSRAYSLGSMGNLFCFDAASGRILWEKDCNKEYRIQMPTWGISASPLVDGDLMIAQIGGAGGACLVAFDKMTGAERWRALDDKASYSTPMMTEQAGRRILVCYTGENVVALNPQSGEVFWKHPFPARQTIIGIATPVRENDLLFMTNFFDGSLMLKLDAQRLSASKLWQRAGQDEKNTDALHSIISTPLMRGGHVYGVDSYGELRCLRADNGDRIWENLDAVPKARWATIHFVEHNDKVWMFNERGELIIGELSPAGFKEIDRAKLIEPTLDQLRQRDGVTWSHPAFAGKRVYARNDKEILCADLSKK